MLLVHTSMSLELQKSGQFGGFALSCPSISFEECSDGTQGKQQYGIQQVNEIFRDVIKFSQMDKAQL